MSGAGSVQGVTGRWSDNESVSGCGSLGKRLVAIGLVFVRSQVSTLHRKCRMNISRRR